MYRIDNATSVATKPAKGTAGTEGYWTKGDPTLGVPATNLDQDFYNMLQEELSSVVLAGGLTNDKTDDTQLVQAIQALIIAGAVSGSASSEDFLQPAHGFSKLDTLYHNGTIWVKGLADAEATSIVEGVLSEVIDADNFTITYSGIIEWDDLVSPDYTVGERVHLSNTTAGGLTDVKPIYAIGEVDKLIGYSLPTGLLVAIDRGDVVVADVVSAPSVWGDTSSKTADYQLLTGDDGDLVYLNSSVSVDTTFTLKALPSDKDVVWLYNDNLISEAKLTVSDGVDDILYLGSADGLYKFVYSSIASAWISTTA